MKTWELNKSQLIVGLILMAVAVLMLLFLEGDGYTAGAVGIGVLGLISIKKKVGCGSGLLIRA